jgi:hypothetical protein
MSYKNIQYSNKESIIYTNQVIKKDQFINYQKE